MADTSIAIQDAPRSGDRVSNVQGNNRWRVPASEASIEAMRRIKLEGGCDCSICLEEFKEEEEGSEMPCEHVFHSGCVEKWLRINRSCPVCRFLMPAEEGGCSRQTNPDLIQLLVRVSRLASSIGGMASGRSQVATQVDDGIGDEPLSQDMHSLQL